MITTDDALVARLRRRLARDGGGIRSLLMWERRGLPNLETLSLPYLLDGQEPPERTQGTVLYRPDGTPVSIDDAVANGLPRRHHLAETVYYRRGCRIRISTMFSGLDMSVWLGGPPVLWETCVFAPGHLAGLWRYASAEAALAGHRRVVELLRAAPRATRRTAPHLATTVRTASTRRMRAAYGRRR